MKVLDLSCSNCGAPLEVPRKLRFVTCAFCNTRLEIQIDGAAAYTTTLDAIAQDIKTLKRQNEVAELDREWQASRSKYLVHSQRGGASVPSKTGSIAGLCVIVPFGIFWTVMASKASNMGAPRIFPLFGLLFIALGIFTSIRSFNKAKAFERDRERYRRRRRDLMSLKD